MGHSSGALVELSVAIEALLVSLGAFLEVPAWGTVRVLLAAPWALLSVVEALKATRGILSAALWALWDAPGAFWQHLVLFLAHLEAIWAILGAFCPLLGRSWALLGSS